MDKQQIQIIFEAALIREFENGPKLKGYFLKELKEAGVNKGLVKKLVRDKFLTVGHVNLKTGTENFYALNEKNKKATP